LKVLERGYGDKFQFCIADAMSLPFDCEYFDAVTVSCGMKSFSDFNVVLREVMRVLKPGG